MDKKKLLSIIEGSDIHYGSPIEAETIHDIILHYYEKIGLDVEFYIEGLTSAAGEGDMNLYTSYYDETINRIILCDEVKFYITFKNKDDVADYIEALYQTIVKTKERFLKLKEIEENAN